MLSFIAKVKRPLILAAVSMYDTRSTYEKFAIRFLVRVVLDMV